MNGPAYILLFGHDAHLLTTKHWVLEAAGYRVKNRTDFWDLRLLLAAEPPELLILCHSLSAQERQCAQDLTRTELPWLRCLLIKPAAHLYSCQAGAEITFAGSEPHRLSSAIQAIFRLSAQETTPFLQEGSSHAAVRR